MKKKNNDLALYRFKIKSSTEVPTVISEVQKCCKFIPLFHISSFIHNTVLVQNLIRELEKNFPGAKVVLLKHDDRNMTCLSVYDYQVENPEQVSDEVLNTLHEKYEHTHLHIEDYRNQLFLRYFTDHLTNLPNLYQLRKDLHDEEDNTLVIIKIDNFQMINNFYGFVVGDYVIEYVSTYLKELFEATSIYRLSGTEFAVILDDKYDFYKLKEYLNNLYKSLQNLMINYQETHIFVNFTLSSCVSQDNSNLFSKVSMALKYAEDNALPYWIYEDSMNFENEYEKNLKLSQAVREAVDNNRVIPYYQAIYDNNQGAVTKYECLARLVDKEGNVLSPQVFIPITKSLKIYNKVTKTILDKSFAEFEKNDYEFSINLSIEDVMNNEVFQYIIEKLKAFPDPSRVTFELLESEAILDFRKVGRFIDEIKRRGAKIAIDDFGSGYSNFAYIINLKVDYIKIDGTLIENIATDKTSLIAVETIVGLAKKLGVKTVAEYVFSSTIFTQVQSLGIDYAQGFYIDKPSLRFSDGLPI
ncbi:GGDEF domain-containing protein [Sulfurimonas sp. C5]|uniref:EAL domain-containing protein n=1 Tax=Sulfurimonas sp. C5 TaxID=3036947 RepID=UPI0024540C6B|nr:GGDEF domain-containing protein [Sulfurimonas sp. C5]MDH4943777.1 GGDEF domain-containing protein [Sulfurimonas sp. C5]